jgi:signal transduction histidine kinase
LIQVGLAVQKMGEPGDLVGVIQVVYEQLQQSGLKFETLSIHRLVDAETDTYQTIETLQTGQVLLTELVKENVTRMWKAGKITYRPNLDLDPGGLKDSARAGMQERTAANIVCILDLPHPNGTMALMSSKVDAFSPLDIQCVERMIGVMTLGISRVADLEELKQSQDLVRKADRDRVLVETAGAAAHEINQPLSVIQGLAQLLIRDFEDDDGGVRKDLEDIVLASLAIQTIFARMDESSEYQTRGYVGGAQIVSFESGESKEATPPAPSEPAGYLVEATDLVSGS